MGFIYEMKKMLISLLLKNADRLDQIIYKTLVAKILWFWHYNKDIAFILAILGLFIS